MPEKQIICAWYSNKMSINRLSAPNSNICLIRLCAWSNFILLLSASCQSSPGPKHFLISSILFSFYPYSALMFRALLLKSKTQIQESICKKNPHYGWQLQVFSVHKSYKWFIFVTKILLASSATTFAQADKLKQHLLTHSGEKPFKCSHCNTFVYNATFPTHKLTT